jgi:hypothetical protein
VGRAVLFTIRLLLQWPRARCALRAVQSAGKSLAVCSAVSSAAAEDGDSLSVILSEAKNLRFISLLERD